MAQALQVPIRGKAKYEESDLERETLQYTIKDQNQDDVAICWYPNDSYSEDLPSFPFQVYVLSSASAIAEDAGFPRKFAAFIEQIGGVDSKCHCHFQVYMRPFPNILACIAHQRREIRYRHRNGFVPRMVSEWASGDHCYNGKIMIVDNDNWADEGVTFAQFDVTAYENRRQFPHWNVAASGDVSHVTAKRCWLPESINRIMKLDWLGAGGQWTEDDLQRRNDGAASPVLYPAIDPAAHHDAEHEEVYELDGTALPGPVVDEVEDDNEDGVPRIIDTFDPFELFLQEQELNEYISETYSDLFGLPVISIWNSKLSRLRPRFSFTLYLAFDFFDKLQIHPKALFRSLNKGLIAEEAWTLDIVTNMPSIDAAFQYHSRATAQRSPQRFQQRKACMHLIVQRIAYSKLPSEILENIEELLLPPEIPTYSSRPRRRLKDFFLYLDKDRQYTGPLIVYSNPDPSCATTKQLNPAFTLPATNLGENILRVDHLRYWHRVSDELHILWSLCGPRYTDSRDPIVPRAHLELSVPEACVWRSTFGIQFINGYLDVKITFQSDQEIVLPCHAGIFSHDLWNECVDVIDLETETVLPRVPIAPTSGPYCLDSWAQTRELGFKDDANPEMLEESLDAKKNLTHFEANTSQKLPLQPAGVWWQYYVRSGILKSGQRYAFRLKPGLWIPRWTYGTKTERDGPFNLPPIPITVDETSHTFEFRVESIGAPHGSFNR